MIRGVYCLGNPGAVLKPMLKVLNTKGSLWRMDCILQTDYSDMEEGMYSERGIEEILDEDGGLIQFRLCRFNENIDQEVKDYDDFIKSDCTCVILCTDVWYFNIYDKEYDECLKLYEVLKQVELEELEYITDENDGQYTYLI